tara:strand:+ start:537 stop:1130 length:594 start_codon:yes stop_codon:yes gene_type:complete
MNNKELAEKYDLSADHFWKQKQSGKWIITHKGCWKIAVQEGIEFERPEIISKEMGQVVLFSAAKLGDQEVWTYGEAYPANCHVPYYWAMAEKRLKDRLTLMLIGVYGEVYSEIEAQEFAAINSQENQKTNLPNNGSELGPPTDKQFKLFNELLEECDFTDEEKQKVVDAGNDAENTWIMKGLIDKMIKRKRRLKSKK